MQRLTIVGCLIILLACCQIARADDRKTPSELIRSRGFDVDEFEVVSQNFPLKVYRLINPLADPTTLHRVPVVCHHGISFNSANMMSASKLARPRKPNLYERVTLYAPENGTDDRSLYFYLSNNNYDVWLLDARGTDRERRVTGDKTSDKAFWDFSLDEQALIDLPTQIEFVLLKTGALKVNFIAYSQSTSLMFALLSMKPEFSDKLSSFVALAPVVYTNHLTGMTLPYVFGRLLSPFTSASPQVPEWFRRPFNWLFTYACSINIIKQTFCRHLWTVISGKDKGAKLEGGMTEDVIKPTSFKTAEQFIHNKEIKDFRMYDYKDELRNMEEYGQPVPPQYNVSKIIHRGIVLFRGTNDLLSTPQDQMILISRLRVPLFEDHILVDYAHIDFITSPTVVRDINEPILRAIDSLSERQVLTVAHTMGNPNPQVQGTELVMDAQRDRDLSQQKIQSSALPKEEIPRGGVNENPGATTVREQLGLKPTA